jgi:hypothetical protein
MFVTPETYYRIGDSTARIGRDSFKTRCVRLITGRLIRKLLLDDSRLNLR